MKEIKVKCLSCGSLEGGDFCGSCHTVLPIEGAEVDFFELFGLEPRPALDAAALKEKFLELSRTLHPDRNLLQDEVTRERVLALSARLNQGYAVLTDTKERLRYLVGRVTEQEPAEAKTVPPEMMELFFEVHDLMDEVDAFLKQRKPAASRIVAALERVDERNARFLERIEALRRRAGEKVEAVEAEIRDLDGKWEAVEDRERIVQRLSELADVLAYMGRLRRSLDQKELALRQ